MKTYGESVLYTPGPVSVPQRVLDAYSRPVMHHRSADFSQELKKLLLKWQWLFNTTQPVLPIHTTGRGAMEAAIANMLRQGDSVICICNGKFGTFFAKIAELYGLTVHKVATDWEAPFSIEELKAACAAHPEARAVTLCHNESSTAVTIDIAPVTAVAKAHGMLTLVDAVSSGGCLPIDFDTCGADALIVAAQKGLMCSAGMSLAILSDAGWKACETSNLPKYFTNFISIRKNVEQDLPETPGSTPVSSVYALLEAATMMEEEGRDELFARHAKLAGAIRASLKAMGFSLFPVRIADKDRSNSLTAFTTMEGITPAEYKSALKTLYGLNIAGGIDHLKSSVLRIGHMGHFYERDALTLVACMEAVLNTKGLLKEPGVGLRACMAALK